MNAFEMCQSEYENRNPFDKEDERKTKQEMEEDQARDNYLIDNIEKKALEKIESLKKENQTLTHNIKIMSSLSKKDILNIFQIREIEKTLKRIKKWNKYS